MCLHPDPLSPNIGRNEALYWRQWQAPPSLWWLFRLSTRLLRYSTYSRRSLDPFTIKECEFHPMGTPCNGVTIWLRFWWTKNKGMSLSEKLD
jgi:hypothetical protein